LKREIQRIEPRSALRIGFFVGLLLGFVIGLFEAAIFKSMSGAGGLPADMQQQLTALTGSSIIMLALVTSLMFSLLAAFLSTLGAVFYNWAARLFGGIEFHLSGDEAYESDEHHHEPYEDDHDA
jgi:ABC-type Fe3+ transport system permease subunit